MKVIYDDFALSKGNLLALGGNLWNQHVSAAIRNRKAGEDELRAAAGAFFEQVLPEMQNFMEQKLAAAEKEIRPMNCAKHGYPCAECTQSLRDRLQAAELQIEAMRPVVNAARDYADAFNMNGCGSGEINDTGKGLRIKQAMLRALEKLDEFISGATQERVEPAPKNEEPLRKCNAPWEPGHSEFSGR